MKFFWCKTYLWDESLKPNWSAASSCWVFVWKWKLIPCWNRLELFQYFFYWNFKFLETFSLWHYSISVEGTRKKNDKNPMSFLSGLTKDGSEFFNWNFTDWSLCVRSGEYSTQRLSDFTKQFSRQLNLSILSCIQ